MATGEVKHTSTSAGADGTPAPIRLGRDGSAIVRNYLDQLGLEGKIFIAGVGLEGTALTGLTTLAETTPTIWLQSPVGGNVVVKPLWFEALITAEGGAAPDWYLSAITVGTVTVTTAGTTVTPQSLGKPGLTSQATLQTKPTTSAWTNLQNVRLRSSENALDNLISVEHITGANTDKDDYMNSLTTIKYEFPFPLYLGDGQAFAFHDATGVTAQDFEWILVWAELDGSAYR